MPTDPISLVAMFAFVAFMLLSIYILSKENYRQHKKKLAKGPVKLSPHSPFAYGGQDNKISCQERSIAELPELMDEVKELIEFHRPCLQYPLRDYWLKFNRCDYESGLLSASIEFPENSKDDQKIASAEIIWSFRKLAPSSQTEISLLWRRRSAFESSYKHNILLSMCAYTEEKIKKANQKLIANRASKAAGVDIHGIPLIPKFKQAANSESSKMEAIFWPSPQDYNEAVQNPRICFIDEELKSGEPELNPLGMPRAMSGTFASVYKIACSERNWAVRCFLNPIKDQKSRYEILAKHLKTQSAKSIVEFSFLEQGICINGGSFPILKMEWIEGEPLHLYLEKHLSDSNVVSSLRKSFREMICDLRAARIAHGDLQHGNIIIREHKPVLVDYDAVFVPEFVRFHSAELGHANYQHPKRAGKHFGLFLDNFAGCLIDTTLVCLEEDPSLWQRFSGGDECLLFRRVDLLNPAESKLFAYLEEHNSMRIKLAINHFMSLLQLELEAIPFLELE